MGWYLEDLESWVRCVWCLGGRRIHSVSGCLPAHSDRHCAGGWGVRGEQEQMYSHPCGFQRSAVLFLGRLEVQVEGTCYWLLCFSV